MATEEHGLELTIGASKAKIGAREYRKATKEVERGAEAATKDASKLNRTIAATEGSAKKGAGGLAVMKQGYLKLIGAAYAAYKFLNVGATFEQAMAEVSTIALRNVDSLSQQNHIMQQLTETARELGATTSFTATEAAGGLLELIKAGYDVEKSQKAIEAVLQLAKAASLDLATSAKMATNTLNMFGLSADNAEHAMDMLYTTAGSVTTNVTELFEALAKVGPIANAAGMSLEETVAAAGALAEGALTGSIAGTAMRGMLARLLDPTEEVKAALKELKLEAKDVQPTILGWAGTFDVLHEAGMNANTAIRIFGQEAVAGASVLAERVELMEQLTQANLDALGATALASQRQADTFKGALKELGSALSEVAIQAWDAAGPVLTEIVRGVTWAVREVSKAIEPAITILEGTPGGSLDLLNAWEGVKREADVAVSYIEMQFDKMVANIGAAIEAVGEKMGDVLGGQRGTRGGTSYQKSIEDALAKDPMNEALRKELARLRAAREQQKDPELDEMLAEAERRHRERVIEVDARYAKRILDIEDRRDAYKPFGEEGKEDATGKRPGAEDAEALVRDLDKARDAAQAVELQNNALDDFLFNMRSEWETIGMTNDEREKHLLLADAERLARQQGVKDVDRFIDALEREIDQMQALRKIADLAYDMGRAFGDAAVDIIDNINSIEDAAERALDNLRRIVLEHLVARPIAEGVGKLLYGIGAAALAGAVAPPGKDTGAEFDYGGELDVARGAVFNNGVVRGMRFGSLFNVPHHFQSGPDRGVIGEGGIEAAMPLARMSDGRLGVLVANGGSSSPTVNMYINTPDADSFRRSERQIWRRARSAAGRSMG
jgi:TP901 family phage tail tape measure protein